MSHTKTLKIIPTCFDHQMIIRFACKTNERMLPHNHT
jgi:hypothetical protein